MGLPSWNEFVDGIRRDVVDFAKDPANAVVDLVTGYDRNEQARVRDEQAAGNAARDDIYARQSGLYGNADGFDDPVLTSPEAFEAMSHEAIKTAVDAMNGEALTASAEGWKKIGESLEQSLNDFRDFISGTIAGNWEGIAADSAERATAKYAEDSAKLANAGKLVGSKIEEAATGVNQVKATVPPVAERSLLEMAFDTVAPTAGAFKRLMHAQDEAHQEAIQIMRTVYTPVMQQADTMVPRLPAPPQVTDPQGNAGSPGIGGPASGSTTSYTPYGAPNTGSTGTPLPTGATPGAGAYTDTGAATAPAPIDSYPTSPNALDTQTDPNSAWTAPAAVNPEDGARFGQSGLGTGVTPGNASAGLGSGGPGSAGLGSAGIGGAGSASGSSGLTSGGFVGGGLGANGSAPGSGASGASAASAGGASTGAGTATSTGRAPGAAGMVPGAGARGRGDDDNQHKTPGYLVNVDNGSELVGRLPLAAPPVIGT